MANELTKRISLGGTNGSAVYPTLDTGDIQFDQANAGEFSNTQVVGTSEENLVMPADFTTLGYAYFKNLDGTNYVKVGINDGGAIKTLMRLRAGKDALVPLEPGITLRAIADTASVKLFYRILEN